MTNCCMNWFKYEFFVDFDVVDVFFAKFIVLSSCRWHGTRGYEIYERVVVVIKTLESWIYTQNMRTWFTLCPMSVGQHLQHILFIINQNFICFSSLQSLHLVICFKTPHSSDLRCDRMPSYTHMTWLCVCVCVFMAPSTQSGSHVSAVRFQDTIRFKIAAYNTKICVRARERVCTVQRTCQAEKCQPECEFCECVCACFSNVKNKTRSLMASPLDI